MDKRYRVVPLEDSQPNNNLMDRIYTEMPAAEPEHPTCYEGEWVCSHAPCPMRMVRLRVKALYHQHLPGLRCPLCLRTLTFRHWLHIIALQEIAAEKVSRPPRGKRGTRSSKKKVAASSV